MGMQFHLALVNNQAQLGGAETVLEQLRAGAQRAGQTVSVHVADGKTYPAHVDPLCPRWLSRLNHSRLHGTIERLFPKSTWTNRGFRQLAEHPCDLVHLHNFHGNYATVQSLAYVAERKPLLWTFHALWGVTGGCDHPGACLGYINHCGHCPQLGRWPIGSKDHTADQLDLKVEFLTPLPLHVVAPSRHIAHTIQQSRVGRNWTVHHIPNGVDVSRFDPGQKQNRELRAQLGLHPSWPVILVVNRNFEDPQKGYDLVEAALANLPAGDVQIVLVGSHSTQAAARLAHPCLAFDYIRCRNQLARFYNAADFFLFASPAETFPCVILEAMAAGCCIVSTPTSGVLEQIHHLQTGWLAREISGSSLAITLQEALTQRDLSRRFGHAARVAVRLHFSETQMVDRYLALYEELVGVRPCTSAPISRLTTALAP